MRSFRQASPPLFCRKLLVVYGVPYCADCPLLYRVSVSTVKLSSELGKIDGARFGPWIEPFVRRNAFSFLKPCGRAFLHAGRAPSPEPGPLPPLPHHSLLIRETSHPCDVNRIRAMRKHPNFFLRILT